MQDSQQRRRPKRKQVHAIQEKKLLKEGVLKQYQMLHKQSKNIVVGLPW